jgi:two-component system chemotaxis response regulator CheY
MKILIVDDDEVSSARLSILLSHYGTCSVAECGKDALRMFSEANEEGQPYSLIALDIDLPDIKGTEVLREIRRYESEKLKLRPDDAARIIMVTVFNDREYVMDSLEGGCTRYLVKPVDRKSLSKALFMLWSTPPMPQMIKRMKPARILAVDDDDISLSKIWLILSQHGSCDKATAAIEAQKLFISAHNNGYPYSLVTLDIDLPDTNGNELLRRIRFWESQHGLGDNPVNAIIISAMNDRKLIEQSVKDGCLHYLLKPFKREKLKEIIDRIGLTELKANTA